MSNFWGALGKDELLRRAGLNPDGTPLGSTDSSAAIELMALRNENQKLKEENERLKNTVLKCPCGRKLRIPR